MTCNIKPNREYNNLRIGQNGPYCRLCSKIV